MSDTKKPEMKISAENKTEVSGKDRIDTSVKKESEISVQETPEQRQIRREKMRQRREQRRKRRQKAIMLRIALVLAGVLIVVGVIWGISALLKNDENKDTKEQKEITDHAEPQEILQPVELDDVLHLSFDSLIADTNTAFKQENTQRSLAIAQGHLTVAEFEGILQQLYQQGYVLVRLQDLVQVQEDGSLKEKELLLIQGKKPLIISQQNVSYSLDTYGQGLPTKLIVDDAGNIVSQAIDNNGVTITGAYDVVTCLNAFVQSHPDFSHEGAKGIIGISGSDGVLGYRIDASFSTSEGNKYASEFGVYDTTAELESLKVVVNALKENGWEFASSGYQYITYGENMEDISQDLKLWKTNLGEIFSDISIFFYPNGKDIAMGAAYSQNNESYKILEEYGFRYFSSLDLANVSNNITKEYLRCNYINVDGYRMYQELNENAGRFEGVLDFSNIYDTNRPSINAEISASETEEA